jgi:hypothetical protein
MSKGHNKKRNVGLIYEQVIQRSSQALVEGRVDDAKVYTQFLKRHFALGSEIFKEYKLFSAIIGTHGVSEKVADRILELARTSMKDINMNKLKKEKGVLINEANQIFGKGVLFADQVEKYRALATVQTLLNEWANPGTLSVPNTARYENQLRNFMMLNEITTEVKIIDDVNDISIKMFHERFNKSYTNKLLTTQKNFLRYMILESSTPKNITNVILETKLKLLLMLESYHSQEKNDILCEKYNTVYKKIQSMDCANKDAMAKQLTMLQLIHELENDNE